LSCSVVSLTLVLRARERGQCERRRRRGGEVRTADAPRRSLPALALDEDALVPACSTAVAHRRDESAQKADEERRDGESVPLAGRVLGTVAASLQEE